MSNLRLPPLHPGEVLREEYMKPYSLTPYKARVHVPHSSYQD
jgi:plasmid maintenance system antidote protein VapI